MPSKIALILETKTTLNFSQPTSMEWGGWGVDDGENSNNSVEIDYEAQQLLETRRIIEKVDDELYADADLYFQEQEELRLRGDVGFVPPASTENTVYSKTPTAIPDDPQEAANLWYANQQQAEKLPIRDWTSNFCFMRVVGRSIDVEPGAVPTSNNEKEEEEEEGFAEDNTREATKQALVQMLMDHLQSELSSKTGKDDEHGVRVASVTKYVPGARG